MNIKESVINSKGKNSKMDIKLHQGIRRTLSILTLIIVLILAIIISVEFVSLENLMELEGSVLRDFKKENILGKLDCVYSIEEKIVRGSSLSGLIEEGEIIEIHFGYYNCNKLEREDVIAYDYKGNSVPIIKIVKGLPGDYFELIESDENWNIFVNGEILRNHQKLEYIISNSGYKMLSLYARDYSNLIPENTYLILGNLEYCTVDSTRFGLISKDNLIGKVFIKN